MPTYIYKAKTKQGQTKAGVQEAANQHELARLLRQQGLVLISAQIAGSERKAQRIDIVSALKQFWRISLVEKMMFAQHLAVMLKAGLSLNRALQVLAEQTRSPRFKKIILQIEKDVRQGISFSQALAKHPRVFNQLFVSMVKVGEVSGTLENVLRLLAEQMRKDHELIARVRGAMIYPAVILVAMLGIGILMMIMVVPKLTQTFTELEIELPLMTRIVIGLSHFLQHYLIIGLVGLVIFIFCIRFILRIKEIKRIFHTFYLHCPIFGSIIQKVNSARFARTSSSLIKSGVEIVQTLQITANTLGNIHFREALLVSAKQVQKGQPLSQVLLTYSDLYPPMVIQMVKVGEETGTLSHTLSTLADFYEEEVNNITKNLSSIIEPILMIIIGAAVGFFAVSMIQPMYSMMGGL